MESVERQAFLLFVALPCEPFVEAQDWSKKAQRENGDYLAASYVSSLPKEVYTDLTQNSLVEFLRSIDQGNY